MKVRLITTAICLLFLVAGVSISAQTNESIRSDRPGQANSPFTVGKQVFQVQLGNNFNQLTDKNDKNQINDFNSVFRYGFFEKFEVGIGLDYLAEKSTLGTFSSNRNGLSSFSAQFRANIIESEGLNPSIGIQYNVNLPVVSEIYKTPKTIQQLSIASNQSFSENIGFSTYSGLSWDGVSSTPYFFYVLNLGFSLTEKWGMFVENYGNLQNKTWDIKFDTGVSFIVNNNLQLDAFGGYDKNQNLNDWFINLGVSWRLPKKS